MSGMVLNMALFLIMALSSIILVLFSARLEVIENDLKDHDGEYSCEQVKSLKTGIRHQARC